VKQKSEKLQESELRSQKSGFRIQESGPVLKETPKGSDIFWILPLQLDVSQILQLLNSCDS
jgi:hypothetical protein